jgi:hypothetical protein
MNHIQIGRREMIRTAYENITPALAAEMLRGNSNNRKLRKDAIQHMASEMSAGRWVTTHQGIAFDDNGRLLDGQHRLHAIIKAGVSVVFSVSRGVPTDSFRVMDGASASAGLRTLKDVTGADRRVLEPCALMVRLDRNSPGKVTFDLVAPYLYGPLGGAVGDIIAAYGMNVPQRSTAPIRLGAALRLISDRSGYVTDQWRALGTLDYAAMSPTIQAFCRYLTDRKALHGGSLAQREMTVLSWRAFDTTRRHLKRFSVAGALDGLADVVAFGRKQIA